MFNTDAQYNGTEFATDDVQGSSLPDGVALYQKLFLSSQTSAVYTLPNTRNNCLDFVTTGVLSNAAKKGKIYPNPVVNELNIEFPHAISTTNITVFDALGKECKGVYIRKVGATKFAIDKDCLCSKVGYIMIKYNGNTETHKYIKL
jgi:hypothetical protein